MCVGEIFVGATTYQYERIRMDSTSVHNYLVMHARAGTFQIQTSNDSLFLFVVLLFLFRVVK
jgi:hypothetical protein